MAKSKLSGEELKMALKEAGVKGLREFGYPTCTVENICTDMIFRQFFLSNLEEMLFAAQKAKKTTKEIEELIAECRKK